MPQLLTGIFTAFGLSARAGLNAYIPLLIVGLLARYTDLIKLNDPWSTLSNAWIILLLCFLVIIEMLADKVPAVNHINDVIQTVVRPAAGAIAFAASANVVTDVHPVLALACGLLMAGTVHVAKAAALRPAVTATTGGAGNIPVSIAEIRIADRILQSLETPIISDGQKYYTSASIGIVTSLPEHQTPEEVLREVDIALYTAKAQGKARYAVFNATLREQAITYLELESDIHRALENQELKLYYQPIINLETGRLVGFEALFRWFHPRRGMVMPLEFIRLAEETGIIITIGQWVLDEACTQLHKWQQENAAAASLFISVNVSSKQLIAAAAASLNKA